MAFPIVPDTLISASRSFVVPQFELQNLPDFPYSDYTELQSKYESLESWFTGSALDTKQSQGDKAVDVYPLKINSIRLACLKHAYALFGEFPDDISSALVLPRVIVDSEINKDHADAVEEALESIWYESNGTAMMMEAGILSQVYGGCVFKASWIPKLDDEKLGGQIKIELINPKEFVALAEGTDYWNLSKAWIVRRISSDTAKRFGVSIAGETGFYIEVWDKKTYEIRINDVPLESDILGKPVVHSGENPFGVVPFVYIPHERVGSFYGNSIITAASIGITKEMNLRKADAGDATNDQSHGMIVMRNVKGTPQMRRLANGTSVLDIGTSQTVTGSDLQPDVFSVTRSNLTESMMRLNVSLEYDIRRELMVPAVAEGEDEGSQRSAATLIMRMWPLTSHVKSERAFWNAGLNTLHKIILKMMAEKNLYGITKKHLEMRLKSKWHPILPRDRQAFVEELVARMGVNLGSPEHLLALAGDVEDIDLVMEQTREWLAYQEEIKKLGVVPYGSEGDGEGQEGALSDGGREIPDSDESTSDKRPEAKGTRPRQGRAQKDNKASS